jgi:hypothetical protein
VLSICWRTISRFCLLNSSWTSGECYMVKWTNHLNQSPWTKYIYTIYSKLQSQLPHASYMARCSVPPHVFSLPLTDWLFIHGCPVHTYTVSSMWTLEQSRFRGDWLDFYWQTSLKLHIRVCHRNVIAIYSPSARCQVFSKYLFYHSEETMASPLAHSYGCKMNMDKIWRLDDTMQYHSTCIAYLSKKTLILERERVYLSKTPCCYVCTMQYQSESTAKVQ